MTPFKTTDLALASFLVASGFEMAGKELGTEEPPVLTWVFEHSDELQEAVYTFLDGSALSEPRALLRANAGIRIEMRRLTTGKGRDARPGGAANKKGTNQ